MHLLFFLVVVICWCHWICTFGRANWVWGGFFHFKQSVGSKYYMLMMMTTKSVCTYVHIQHGRILPSHILREFLLFYLCDDGINQQRKKNSKWQKDLTIFFLFFGNIYGHLVVDDKLNVQMHITNKLRSLLNWGKICVIANAAQANALLLRFFG